MAESVSRFTLNVDHDIPNIISSKQFDVNSRILEITLINGNGTPVQLNGTAVRINALKWDSTSVFNECEIVNAANGIIRVTLTDQLLSGRAPLGQGGRDEVIIADISIHSEGESRILTSRLFEIRAQVTVRDDVAIESSNEFGAVVLLFQDVWDLRETIRQLREMFGNLDDDHMVDGPPPISFSSALNRTIHWLHENSAAEIVDDVREVLRRIGDTDVAGGANAQLVTLLNLLRTGMGARLNVTIQRGTQAGLTGLPTGATANITVPMANVGSARTWIILQAARSNPPSQGIAASGVELVSVFASSFVVQVAISGGASQSFSWQAITYN